MTGMDFSRRSIDYARENDTASEYVLGDYLLMDYIEQFDAVTLIYCDYAALTEAERATIDKRVLKALKPGGMFILDVFTDVRYKNISESATWHAADKGFWSAEPYLCLQATYLYKDNTVSADRYVIVTDKGVTDYIVWDTIFTRRTLSDELAAAGFRVQGVFDDACGSPYTGESETLCCIARKAD